MPSTIICPKCRKPQEESGRLTCPDCSSILPSSTPPVAVAAVSTPARNAPGGSNALDEFAIPQRPTGAMTLLRNDLRSDSKDRPQSGWLDNLMPKKAKDAAEAEPASKARPTRENSGLGTTTEEAPADSKKSRPQPQAQPIAASVPAPAPAPIKPPAPAPVRAEVPSPSHAAPDHFDADAKPKIPLAAVGSGLAFAVLATLGLLQGKEGLLGSLVFLTVGVLGASLLGICQREAAKRAFWQGFAVFGIGYLLMAFVPAFPYQAGVELPTNRLVKVVHAKLSGTPEDPRSSFAIMKIAEPTSSDTPAPFDPDASPKPAVASPPMFTPGDVRQFTVVGHCGFTLFFAFIGSALSGWFYRSRLLG